MKTNRSPSNQTFGLAVYFSSHRTNLVKVVSELLDSAHDIAGISFPVVETSAPDSDRFRTRKATQAERDRIIDELSKGRLAHLTLYDRNISPHIRAPNAAISILGLQLNVCGNLRRLDLLIPRNKLKLKNVIAWCERFVTENRIIYGFMCSGASLFVQSFLSLIGMMDFKTWMKMDANAEDPLCNEVGFYSQNLHLLPSRIPRAFWGNILSKKHVAQLGGESKIRKDLSGLEISEWGDSYFIRFRQQPWALSKKSFIKLNDYFAPIRFPNAPPPQLR